jgi:hypothetical protein
MAHVSSILQSLLCRRGSLRHGAQAALHSLIWPHGSPWKLHSICVIWEQAEEVK